jgi:hypothetical protein
MTPLHDRIPRLPYRYQMHASLNDYQVTIGCPAGRAIITEIDGGEDYHLETLFLWESPRTYSIREWYGEATPTLAIDRLMFKTNVYLGARGMEPPPLEAPRRKTYAVLLALVLGVLATVALLLLFSGTDNDGDGPRPSTSFTVAPETAR